MSEWKDISSAPRDGTRVMAWGSHSSLYSALGPTPTKPTYGRSPVAWDGHEWVMVTPDEFPTVGVSESEWDGPQAAGFNAELWMPLPDPPSS